MRWDLLGVVWRKELVDGLRDRRAVAIALLMPLLGPGMMALVITLVTQQARTVAEKPLALAVAGAERAPNLMAFLREHDVDVVPAPADPEAAVREGDVDLVLIIPEEHAARLREGAPAPVRLVLDDSRQFGRAATGKVRGLLEEYSRRIGTLRLLLRGVHPAALRALAVEERDLATAQSRAGQFLSILPAMVVMILFAGGMAVATDATAGERERQSLEPLLLLPVPRQAVVLGKLLAAASFSAVALAETVVGFGLVPVLLPTGSLGFPIRLDPLVLVRVVVLLLPLLLLVAGIMILAASRARTFKAAQSTMSLLMLVPYLPGVALGFLPIKLRAWMYLVPAMGEQLLVTRLLRGDAVPATAQLASMAATSAWALLAAWAAVRTFESEQALFGRLG